MPRVNNLQFIDYVATYMKTKKKADEYKVYL